MCRFLVAWVALFVCSSAVFAQPAAWADKMFGADLVHDFGIVARGAQLKYSFKMTNIWKEPLHITELKVSCGCLRADPTTKVLQPGETGTLHIHMDAKQFQGPKTIKIYVTVGPKYISTATLTVSANARGDVTLTPNELDFANIHRGQTPTKAIDIEYTGNMAEWRVTEIVKNASAPFELKVEPLTPRKGYRILATMKAEPPAGAFKQDVILKTNDPASPILTFHIVGNVQAGLAVSPSPIVVRDLKVGESQTKKVFVRAPRPFRVTAVEGQGDGVTVDIPNRQDTTLVLTVHIDPKKAGDLRRLLMIRTDLDMEQTPLVIEGTIEP
jgi:Protein of unknown function (DUF1573)